MTIKNPSPTAASAWSRDMLISLHNPMPLPPPLIVKKKKRKGITMTENRLKALWFIKETPFMQVGKIKSHTGCNAGTIYGLEDAGYITSSGNNKHNSNKQFTITKKGEGILTGKARPVDLKTFEFNIFDEPGCIGVVLKLMNGHILGRNDLESINYMLRHKAIDIKFEEVMKDALENLKFVKKAAKLDLNL